MPSPLVLRAFPPPGSDLPPLGPLRVGDGEIGAGRPVAAIRSYVTRPFGTPSERQQSALWLTDDVVPCVAQVWRRLADRFPATGLWPLVLHPLAGEDRRPWGGGEPDPVADRDVAALDPQHVLANGWADCLVPLAQPPRVAHLAPFAALFPGVAAPLPRTGHPAVVSADVLDPRDVARLGLVPCRRPADSVALIGWLGAINVIGPAEVAAVLRSWEERFGVALSGLGFDTLTLLVPHPPVDLRQALPIAAEVAALCPDALWQGSVTTLAELARTLVDQPVWRLWFD